MKPLQIGLLVLAGALGGAVIMKFMQRPRPVPAPVVSAVPAPKPAPATAAPAPVETKPTAMPEPAKPTPELRAAPAAVSEARRTKPVRTAHAPVTMARNLQPAPRQTPAPPPAREPVRESPVAAPPAPAAPEPTPEPAPDQAAEPAQEQAAQPAPSVTLQAGLLLPVRLGQSLSSDHNQPGDTFTATLDAPVSADGFVIAERGARVEGRVLEAQRSGKLKGDAVLTLELTTLHTSDGQHVAIQTEMFHKQAPRATGEDVGMVAAAAGVGAIIGAMAGGGKGAAIGAGAGGAAGVGGVAMTRTRAVSLPTETKVSFRLKSPVTLTERLNR